MGIIFLFRSLWRRWWHSTMMAQPTISPIAWIPLKNRSVLGGFVESTWRVGERVSLWRRFFAAAILWECGWVFLDFQTISKFPGMGWILWDIFLRFSTCMRQPQLPISPNSRWTVYTIRENSPRIVLMRVASHMGCKGELINLRPFCPGLSRGKFPGQNIHCFVSWYCWCKKYSTSWSGKYHFTGRIYI